MELEDTPNKQNTTTPTEGAKRTSRYVDPQTGKKLSGAAIRKLKKETARQQDTEPRGHKRPRE
ncbi:hypothetical protein X777_01882 [Ooceraea biroi]|uniref:Uncharacterized protein n=1 Tax=Ooceraea biroi TaxID=2015173 RepID=A0A026WSU5_OOCBI|nr:hypothetical protein X777_01882 [Ooceraea biroi]